MSIDALKQAIENNISLPNGKVVMDIHFRLQVSFVGDCFQYRAYILQYEEEIIAMLSIFGQPFNLTWIKLYLTTADTHKHVHNHHQPPISASSLNFEDFDK